MKDPSLSLADAARLCSAFLRLKPSVCIDTWIRPRWSRGAGHYGSRGLSGCARSRHSASCHPPLGQSRPQSTLECAGVGQAVANFLPLAFCFQLLVGLLWVSALPNTRPHSPPKLNILYRCLALLLCSPHGALCYWLGLILGFLKAHTRVRPTLTHP